MIEPKITRRKTSSSKIGANKTVDNIIIGAISVTIIIVSVFCDPASIPNAISILAAMVCPTNTKKKPIITRPTVAPIEAFSPLNTFQKDLLR
ncbi:hypothetical protein UACE39S_03762 [Ureibacillus acetophenoni]